ncbi:hypothetical protein SARC_06417 [Sphaeroforma arctica JP610]|uniref:DNA-directed RNA polymerase n=1 Tax=Sphaeroforma arctica JP610 TaxID=667725 RepID=A0A0L0FWP5_9EUKA|nr:hypothetical protein SARC_06417 [Sphaeroforma arctica JP610]KNC81242.1 hypothetical protein SARC_06417 [Sphaeroforma arctica JP610]|eukprot:XP_014155144.1 hypothetical protein SARC_06417 [Sphaeroforma arctica JP610]
MPFCADGMIPDLILNPCALPSRMTLSQILEGAHSIAALSRGISQVNKTAWCGGNYVEEAIEELKAVGYSHEGTRIMFDGTTGLKMETPIFIAPAFYHRLKHLVADKIYSRSVGSVKAITRQPLSGRSSNGALRLGEMELSCLSAHGASSMLVDKALECSDKYTMVICSTCGNIVNSQRDSCAICGTSCTVRVVIPYVFKLLMHNMAALGVTTKMFPKISA